MVTETYISFQSLHSWHDMVVIAQIVGMVQEDAIFLLGRFPLFLLAPHWL